MAVGFDLVRAVRITREHEWDYREEHVAFVLLFLHPRADPPHMTCFRLWHPLCAQAMGLRNGHWTLNTQGAPGQ